MDGKGYYQNNDETFSNIKTDMGDGSSKGDNILLNVVSSNRLTDSPSCANEDIDLTTKSTASDLLYAIDDNPPWYLCLLLGFQHYLTSFGSTLSVPLVLAGPLCFGQDMVGLSELIATYFFVSGITTLLQSSIGIRLPIIQGATFAFLAPTIVILNLPEWHCPSSNISGILTNMTMIDNVNQTDVDGRELWQSRLREIQGAICVASLFQVVIGSTGLLTLILRYVGPLTIAPTITLIGLSLFEVASAKASAHWWIAITTVALIAIFSQYLTWVTVPLPSCGNKFTVTRVPIFKLFPILLAIIVSWLLCAALTASGALPNDPTEWGYHARTDIKINVIRDTSWFRVPYPGQWGMPTVSVGAVLGMLAGVLASMVESIGDYYACARLSGAPPPPSSAINRGITIEGIGCIIAGLIGTGNGTTSYSENVGAIGITRVGSLRVIQAAGILLVIFGCIGKMGAVFVTIPDPVVGGLFLSMFGMITAVGISNLQYVNMNSSRNLFVIASSFFLGLAIPYWVSKNEGVISTGVDKLDQIFQVLASTSMFVGGAIGFFLDATLPGTPEDRGLIQWLSASNFSASSKRSTLSIYDVPLCGQYLRSKSWMRYIPLCPASDVKQRVESDGKGNGMHVKTLA